MLFTEKTVLLKDGQTALLRAPSLQDAQPMLDYLKAIAGETEFLLRYPEECQEDAASEVAFLDGVIRSDTQIMIVCEVNGVLAGNCILSRSPHLKTRHRASVAISLLRRFWGLGIGTAMIAELTALARAMGLAQLELDYIEGNARARGLYEKMGFCPVAQVPDAYRLRDGSSRKSILMLKKL